MAGDFSLRLKSQSTSRCTPGTLLREFYEREIEAAHELDRPIIPVLHNISHEKYLQRRPEWRLALGAGGRGRMGCGGQGRVLFGLRRV